MNIDEALDFKEKAIKDAENKKREKWGRELNRRKSEFENLRPRIEKVIEIGNKIFKKFGVEKYRPLILETTKDNRKIRLFTDSFYHTLGFMFVGNSLFLGEKAGGACGKQDFYTNGNIIVEIDGWGCHSFLEDFELWEKAFYKWLSKEFSMDAKPDVPTTTEVIVGQIKKVLTVGSSRTVGNVLDELYKKYDKNLVNQAMCDFLRDQYLV